MNFMSFPFSDHGHGHSHEGADGHGIICSILLFTVIILCHDLFFITIIILFILYCID